MNLKIGFFIIGMMARMPVMPEHYSQEFEEQSNIFGILKGSTKGTFYYDFINKRLRMDRESGKYDRFCGTTQILKDTPCSHVVKEGKRFLVFPKLDYCCECCTEEQGCGLLKKDWLNDATLVKEFNRNGKDMIQYVKQGQTDNFVTIYKDNELIQQIEQDSSTLNFDRKTFDIFFDDKIFEIPQKCEKSCGRMSLCSFLPKQFNC